MKKITVFILTALMCILVCFADEEQVHYFYDPNVPSANIEPIACDTTLGGMFTFDEGYATSLIIRTGPTWNGDGNAECDLELYQWLGDYYSSVSGQPITRFHDTGHEDNAPYVFPFESPIPPGEYLWVMKNAVSSTGQMGIWLDSDTANTVSFAAGQQLNGDFHICITLDMTSEMTFEYSRFEGTQIPGVTPAQPLQNGTKQNLLEYLSGGGSAYGAAISISLFVLAAVFLTLSLVLMIKQRRVK